MSEIYLSNRYPINTFLNLTGGEMSGPISTYGIKISSAIDYGTTLPETGTEGQLFFQLSDPYYELPIGGTTNQALVKIDNTDRNVKWASVVFKTGDTMTGALKLQYSSPNIQCIDTANSNLAISLNIGSDHINHGIYSNGYAPTATTFTADEKWIIYRASDGEAHSQLKIYSAVWNDYAEYRKDNPEEKDNQQPGRCVREVGDGTLALTIKRLERGCEIISDTFGFAIGQDEENGYNTPIASNGRVLAYPYESIDEFKNHIGWPVCSGPNGTVSIMTEEEEEKYPSRIVGTISEIPTYKEWGTSKIQINGRIWIRIK